MAAKNYDFFRSLTAESKIYHVIALVESDIKAVMGHNGLPGAWQALGTEALEVRDEVQFDFLARFHLEAGVVDYLIVDHRREGVGDGGEAAGNP